jgi:hypothetical protein
MTTLATAHPTIQRPEPEFLVDDAQLAAAAFPARYSGGTLDAEGRHPQPSTGLIDSQRR